jgi:hypothetical protein
MNKLSHHPVWIVLYEHSGHLMFIAYAKEWLWTELQMLNTAKASATGWSIYQTKPATIFTLGF